MDNLPSLEVLILKLRRSAELQSLAQTLLTPKMYAALPPRPKLVELREAIMRRAGTNVRVRQRLAKVLYARIEVTATTAQELLGINVGLRNKLIAANIFVPTSQVPNQWGKGMVKLISYANVLACYHDPRFQALKAEYVVHHEARKASAAKAVATKLAQTRKQIADFDLTVKRVPFKKLYAKALNSRLAFLEELAIERGRFDLLTSYAELAQAPAEVQNRWVDNYIRHELTNYDEAEHLLAGMTGKNQMYVNELADKVTAEIQRVYPFYHQDTYLAQYLRPAAP